MRFGLHTGQQECSLEDLVAVWRLAEEVGFDSIFTSDHFYPIPREDGSATCYEPVATLTALALETTRVRIGCLVWAVGFRSPGVVAKAVATIDVFNQGRVELGLGTCAMEAEYTAFGYGFPSARTRLDQLEEACVVVPGRLLLAGSANVLTVPTISESPASCRGVRTGASTSRPGSARANPRNAVDTWRCRAGVAPSFPASRAWIASGRLAGPAR
ncbi:MAG: LLM class flavin-dependent oxidoreductase [bacterium]|nr:LLM class flavin-dependent oxidoreductase [bacterium]